MTASILFVISGVVLLGLAAVALLLLFKSSSGRELPEGESAQRVRGNDPLKLTGSAWTNARVDDTHVKMQK